MAGKTGFFARRWILAGIILLFSVGFLGCGIKGPPVPPQRLPVPAVTRLAYQVADGSVTLNWSLPGPLSGRQARLAVFCLYQSRSALELPACDGCPLVFEKVATVPYVHTDANRYTTDTTLDPGYRYLFKVRIETGDGKGPDSNSVQFDYPAHVPSGRLESP